MTQMEDHARGCQGRQYTCTCGFDDQVDRELARAREQIAECRIGKELAYKELSRSKDQIANLQRAATYEADVAQEAIDTAKRAEQQLAEYKKDAERWRQAVRDKEFPIYRNGEWMHVCRTTGKILIGTTPEEVMDIAIDAAIAVQQKD